MKARQHLDFDVRAVRVHEDVLPNGTRCRLLFIKQDDTIVYSVRRADGLFIWARRVSNETPRHLRAQARGEALDRQLEIAARVDAKS